MDSHQQQHVSELRNKTTQIADTLECLATLVKETPPDGDEKQKMRDDLVRTQVRFSKLKANLDAVIFLLR